MEDLLGLFRELYESNEMDIAFQDGCIRIEKPNTNGNSGELFRENNVC